MAMLSFGGIDVSKDRLDVMVLPEEQCPRRLQLAGQQGVYYYPRLRGAMPETNVHALVSDYACKNSQPGPIWSWLMSGGA
jgi:hypothetical protein